MSTKIDLLLGVFQAIDNRNNYVEATINPAKQRVSVGAGLGITGEQSLDNNVKIIGTAGVTGKFSSNVGVSVEKAQRQHDNSFDTPLRPRAMGVVEMRDVLNDIIAQTGGSGDLGKLTVQQVWDTLHKHPNTIEPKSLKRFEAVVSKLEAVAYTPPTDQPQDVLQKLPAFLLKPHTATELIMPLTLSEINEAAERIQTAITSKGGAEGIANSVTSRANEFLTSMGKPALPSAVADHIQRGVSSISDEAEDVTNKYSDLRTAKEIKDMRDKMTALIQLDPEVQTTAFVGVAVLTPQANAALIAQKSAVCGIGNIDRIAGKGIHSHSAITQTIRGEVGIGSDNLSFSSDTAQKLNLSIANPVTSVGGYAFVEKNNTYWMGIDGTSRKTIGIGLGASVSTPLEGGHTGILSVEGQKYQIENTGPGNLPAKSSGSGFNIKAGRTF
jgi:hypothetical protein